MCCARVTMVTILSKQIERWSQCHSASPAQDCEYWVNIYASMFIFLASGSRGTPATIVRPSLLEGNKNKK